jgi:hypothetical protein
MAEAGAAMMEEGLVSQHPLALQLMYERFPGFAKSEKVAGCPRLRLRANGALKQAVRNPELLALLELPVGAPPPEKVCSALNKKDGHGNLPIHCALRDKATSPELVRAMLDVGGEAMLGVPGSYKCLPLHQPQL